MLLKVRIPTLVLFGCLASVAYAQVPAPPVGGSGTPNFVAKFTGHKSIGNTGVAELQACFSRSDTALLTGDTSIAALLCLRDPNPDDSSPRVTALTSSPTSDAFWGLNNAPTGSDATGVRGTSISADRGIGVRGQVENPQAAGGIGVLGEAICPHCDAGVFNAIGGGNILVGIGFNAFTAFRVDANGNVFASTYNTGGADFAESMAVTGDRSRYAAGDLLVIDSTASRHLALARQPYSTLVAGIYSTKPGIVGSTRKLDMAPPADEVPLAVVGIVPCKVTAENGPIQVGDLLVTSSTPGHAMKGTNRSKLVGAVVGKALEPLQNGKGVIQVLVTLQ